VKYGQGFGEKIAHLALTGAAKAESKYYYRVEGLDMKWKQFQPVSFPEKPGRPGYKDLCSLPTIGWKEQGELGEEGIGFVHKGTTRYMVSGRTAAKYCCEMLWATENKK